MFWDTNKLLLIIPSSTFKLYQVEPQHPLIQNLFVFIAENTFLSIQPNLLCIMRFSHSGCLECELFSALCELRELFYLLLLVVLFPDLGSFLKCKLLISAQLKTQEEFLADLETSPCEPVSSLVLYPKNSSYAGLLEFSTVSSVQENSRTLCKCPISVFLPGNFFQGAS